MAGEPAAAWGPRLRGLPRRPVLGALRGSLLPDERDLGARGRVVGAAGRALPGRAPGRRARPRGGRHPGAGQLHPRGPGRRPGPAAPGLARPAGPRRPARLPAARLAPLRPRRGLLGHRLGGHSGRRPPASPMGATGSGAEAAGRGRLSVSLQPARPLQPHFPAFARDAVCWLPGGPQGHLPGRLWGSAGL